MNRSTLGSQEAEEFGARLRKCIEDSGMSGAELGRLIGASQQTIGKLCAGKVRTTGFILDLAWHLNVDPYWLQTGKYRLHVSVKDLPFTPVKAVSVPLVLLSSLKKYKNISEALRDRGLPKMVVGDPSFMSVPGENLFVIELDDNSMSPSIGHGNRVLFSTEIEPVPQELVLCKVVQGKSNPYCIRELREHKDGSYMLYPHNPAFSSLVVTDDPEMTKIQATGVYAITPLLKRG